MSQNPNRENIANTHSRMTRGMVFWWGVVGVLGSLMCVAGSHALYVYSKSIHGVFDKLAAGMDVLAMIGFVAGCVAIVTSQWIPSSRQKITLRQR